MYSRHVYKVQQTGLLYKMLYKVLYFCCKRDMQKRPTEQRCLLLHKVQQTCLLYFVCGMCGGSLWRKMQGFFANDTGLFCGKFKAHCGMRMPYHTATLCNTLHHTAPHCNTLQHTATCVCPTTLQHSATHYTTLQHTAAHCNTLQHAYALPHCNTLQCTATTHCNTLQLKATGRRFSGFGTCQDAGLLCEKYRALLQEI